MISGVATVPTLGKIRAELFIIRRRATTFIKAEDEAVAVLAVEAVAAAVRVVAAALRRFPSTQAPIVAAAARQEEEGLITVRW